MGRLTQAWDLFTYGQYRDAAEILFFGDIEEPFEITTKHPIFSAPTRDGLIEKLRLPSLSDKYFQQGQLITRPLEKNDQITFNVEWKNKQPRVDITIESQFWDMCLILKHDDETGLFSLDEAELYSYDFTGGADKGFLHDHLRIVTDDNIQGKEILPPFLNAFSWAAKQIILSDKPITAEQFQTILEDKIKPIQRIAIRHQADVARTLEKLAHQM